MLSRLAHRNTVLSRLTPFQLLVPQHQQSLTLLPARGIKLNVPVKPVQLSTWGRLKKRFGLDSSNPPRYKTDQLRHSGIRLYLICSEYPVYLEFIEKLHLPDTFKSWYSITALHLWLCLVRLVMEGEEAKIPREIIFEYFIKKDLISRTRGFNIKNKNDQLTTFQNLFYAMIIGYDEGMLSQDDRVLAGALWRGLFSMDAQVSPEALELSVQYVHRQLAHLDSLSADQVLGSGYITFLPLEEQKQGGIMSNETFFNQRLLYALNRPANR